MGDVAKTQPKASLFPFLLLLSGFAGISYELLYARLLGNIMGDQWVVSAAILLTFLLGIGIGTRYAFHLWRHLWLIEVCIGLYAIGFALGIDLIEAWLYSSRSFFGQGLGTSLLQCILLLAPVTILIGCSLPLFAGYLSRLSPGLAFARAYTWHSFGAALTILLVEFWLMRQVGLQTTVFSIASINFLVAALAWFGYGELRQQAPQALNYIKLQRHQLIALALLSIASAIFQLWLVKIAEFLLGPFRESFALVLALVLLGIAIGTWLVRRFKLSFKHVVLANLAGLIWLIASFNQLVELYASLYPHASDSAVQIFMLKLGLLTLLAGLPAISFGATIPALITSQKHVARESGHLLFISSLANAVGFLLMVFVLHQHFAYGTLITIITILSALGLFIYWRGHKLAILTSAGFLATVVICQINLWNEDILYIGHDKLHSTAEFESTKLKTKNIKLFKGPQDVFSLNALSDGRTFLHINGYRSMNINKPHEQMVGAISSQFSPRTDKALVLGVGSGATAATVGLMFDHVDAVEINAVLIDNLDLMSEANFNITQADNINIIHDDGIHFTKVSNQKYPLIINTVTTPLYFSSSKLYTIDFLQTITQSLAPDGVYVTWVDTRIGDRGMDITLNTLSRVFKHCALNYLNTGYYLLLCSQQELTIHQPKLIANTSKLHDYLLHRFGIIPEVLPYSLLTGKAFELVGNSYTPINTLDYPALEFEMAQLQEGNLIQFYERLTAHMQISDVETILKPATLWEPLLLGIFSEFRSGDSFITKTWKKQLSETRPKFETEFQYAKLNYYAYYASNADTAMAHYDYGYHLYNAGDYQVAIQEFNRTLELEPGYQNANFFIGAGYENIGNLSKALKYYSKQLDYSPDNIFALISSGIVNLKQNQPKKALVFFDKTLSIEKSERLYFLRSKALEQIGNINAAKESLQLALDLSPDSNKVKMELKRLQTTRP